MSDAIHVAREGAVRRIRLGKGEGNFLDFPAVRALTEAVAGPAQGDERLIVIEGNGPDFCAGRAAGGGFPPGAGSLELAEGVARPILALYAALRASRLPVAAAVRGRALGLGCALAVTCDITWAETGAVFSLPEMDKDLPPTLALTALAPRIGPKAAGELVLSRRQINADEARAIGICARVLPSAELDDEISKLGERMATNSLRSLATIKAYFAVTSYGAQEQMSDIAAELLAASMSENLREPKG